MGKRKLPSKQKIRNALLTGLFNPKEPGPYSIIMEFSDFNYCITRAYETLRAIPDADKVEVSGLISKALSLLALAKVQHEETESV